MMNNFLDFIEKDISAKKELVASLPLNTKTDKKKYNLKIEEITNKYNEYKKAILNFMAKKVKTFEYSEETDLNAKLNDKLSQVEKAMFYLNPYNNSFEKCGFGDLVYKFENYSNFDFNTLNKIIDDYIVKFEEAGIFLTSNDFMCSCYVYQYMFAFLKNRKEKPNDYNNLSELFEKIYWRDPEIFAHIGLNFRILIFNNMDKFDAYILKKQQKIRETLGLSSYEECKNSLKTIYTELSKKDFETIGNIISLAKAGTIDINNYLKTSKVRSDIFNSFLDTPFDEMNEVDKQKAYDNFRKLKINIEEYAGYAKLIPIINYFKKEYEELLVKSNAEETKEKPKKSLFGFVKKKITNSSAMDDLNAQITVKEKELSKINKLLFDNSKGNTSNAQLKADSTALMVELANLYNSLYHQYIKENVTDNLNTDSSIDDILKIFYNFDYLKNIAMKSVDNNISYSEILRRDKEINSFAINPNHLIVKNIKLLSQNSINSIIINHYKINNINVTDDDLSIDSLEEFLNKIKFVLRTYIIDNSSLDEDKIWFIVQVAKVFKKEEIEL